MPNQLCDLAGSRFGRLTVLRQGPRDRGRTYWICICDCTPGREVKVRADVLRRDGGVRNCGCRKNEKAAQAARKSDDVIGYGSAHDRVRKARGHARTHLCVTCGGSATDWALKKDAPTRRIAQAGPSAGYPFSPNPGDYQPMCRSCHGSYDRDVPWRPKPRVVRGITRKILSGDFAVGVQLPPLKEIAGEYGVGSNTVHRATVALARLGLIEPHGRGYRVAPPDGWWTFQPARGGA